MWWLHWSLYKKNHIMLHSLYIKNLAIIDEIRVDFQNGLNIITGETGSGKTLIIKAIKLLLGDRFSGEVLRTGANQMIIEGVFSKNGNATTIRRLYQTDGKSKTFINEEPVNLRKLLKVTRTLVDLHGQHEHQNLLDVNTHIHYLDAFGSCDTELVLFKNLYNKMQSCQNELNDIKKEQNLIEAKQELHNYQLKELTLHPLSEEYENKITKQHQLLSNAEKIKDTLSSAVSILDNGENCILAMMNQLNRYIEGIADHDDQLAEISKRINSNIIEIEDIVHIIHNIDEDVRFNNIELTDINEILSHLELLKRKYGGSMKSVTEYYHYIKTEKEKTEGINDEIDNLNKELNILQNKLFQEARCISKKRHANALKLEKSILDNLQQLNMLDIDFKIKILSDMNNMKESGIDICEFFISTNMGETLLPLSKIASGGEISRIMLAIKMSLQSQDIVSTLIFDEIDSGISGPVADQVGSIIENLSQTQQILCITHLSQIAGKGNHHYKVQKKIINYRNVAEIIKLTENDRVNEVASLISGKEITKASRQQAATLLEHG